MPDQKKRDDRTAPPTKGEAEGKRNKPKRGDTHATDRISLKQGNVIVGKNPDKAEGPGENVDASLKKKANRGGGEKNRK